VTGDTGPTGATGATGDTGPTGATGPATLLSGLQVQYSTGTVQIIADGAAIPFNSVVNGPSPDLTLNVVTGEITIDEPGNYYVSWWIAVDGATAATTITFTLELDAAPLSSASTPILTDQMSGAHLITVVGTPAILTLVNANGNDVGIANTTVQANLVIAQLAP
jgi:hypothetical protein